MTEFCKRSELLPPILATRSTAIASIDSEYGFAAPIDIVTKYIIIALKFVKTSNGKDR
jgi:hypothetical protein